ncbi:MAG TPA: hypothetical protein DIS90_14770 [Cytophagales bacterium]|nr:hypothetical protein [Cytophagales bacterium]
MTLANKRLIAIVLSVVLLLFVPLIAMQFTDEVNWKLGDFIIAAALLFGAGLVCEWVLRKVPKSTYRIAIIAVVLAILLLIWVELAVGLFGTPFSGT